MFFFALRVREVTERLGAQVEDEGMADRAFRVVERGGMHGGTVPVALGCVEIEVGQAVQMGKGIIGEQPGAPGIRLLVERGAAGAFEDREKMSGCGAIQQERADGWQEAAAAGMIVERARDTQSQPRIIG